jgi:hypothetical protein
MRSGDRKTSGEEQPQNLTTETRRHGEGSGDRGIGGSGDLPASEMPGHDSSRAAKRKMNWALTLAALGEVVAITGATLREIFDQSAYERFLARTGLTHSAASYRAFQSERDAVAASRARCC